MWAVLERIVLSYMAGLLAAVSPCVIILVPLVVYRFSSLQPTKPGGRQGGKLCQVLLFVLGFQASYLVFGHMFRRLLTSSLQNGFKMGLGGFFVVVSALSLAERIDPLSLPIFQHTFLMGLSFAMLLSLNPCTVPFLALVLSLSTTQALVGLLSFAQGLLTPAILAVLLGHHLTDSCGRVLSLENMARAKKVSALILAGSGAYLLYAVDVATQADVYLSSFLFLLSLTLTARALNLFPLEIIEIILINRNNRSIGRKGKMAVLKTTLAFGAGLAFTALLLLYASRTQHDAQAHTQRATLLDLDNSVETTTSPPPSASVRTLSTSFLSPGPDLAMQPGKIAGQVIAPDRVQVANGIFVHKPQPDKPAGRAEDNKATATDRPKNALFGGVKKKNGEREASSRRKGEEEEGQERLIAGHGKQRNGPRRQDEKERVEEEKKEEEEEEEEDEEEISDLKCVDLSMVPDCDTCSVYKRYYLVLVLCWAAGILHYEAQSSPHSAVHHLHPRHLLPALSFSYYHEKGEGWRSCWRAQLIWWTSLTSSSFSFSSSSLPSSAHSSHSTCRDSHRSPDFPNYTGPHTRYQSHNRQQQRLPLPGKSPSHLDPQLGGPAHAYQAFLTGFSDLDLAEPDGPGAMGSCEKRHFNPSGLMDCRAEGLGQVRETPTKREERTELHIDSPV
eukprot:g55089.t1